MKIHPETADIIYFINLRTRMLRWGSNKERKVLKTKHKTSFQCTAVHFVIFLYISVFTFSVFLLKYRTRVNLCSAQIRAEISTTVSTEISTNVSTVCFLASSSVICIKSSPPGGISFPAWKQNHPDHNP